MKTKAPPKSFLFCAALLALFMAFPSLAGTFTSDFSDPGQLGLTLNGGLRPAPNDALPYPAIEDGVLKLTYAENGETGSIVLDELDPGQTLGGFTATFKVKICCGSSTSADGMSFYFGNDIDSSARFGEEGPDNGQGITVSLDTYDNVDGNPLDDVKTLEQVRFVMKEGRISKRP